MTALARWASGTVPALAVAVAVGIAVQQLLTSFSYSVVGGLASYAGLPEGWAEEDVDLIRIFGGRPEFLVLRIGGATFSYGIVLAELVALALVALAALGLVRLGRRATTPCPHCLSPVPAAARACAFCSLDLVEPGEPPD